ncbi:MAG: cytochrome-c oxidase [Planctomycetes bacterium RBG_13_60_9]|nr:MAG: cytochrome-c oxidase [Planctomycetes bacterium RBG_13_60_9]
MRLDYFRRPHGVALAFIVMGSIWFVIGTFYGLLSAIHLVAPEFFNNIPWIVFGRTRPAHTNTVIYGFVAGTLIGCGAYYMPTLLRTKLWSEPLGWISFVLWNVTVLSGPTAFAFGYTQGREYAEYVWVADVALEGAVLTMLLNAVMTLVTRKADVLYVSVWYFVGTFLWTTWVYPIGNVMWHPGTGAESGLLDSILLWFYGHNLVGLILTPLAVGAAFYVIPYITSTPLYSHTLSLIGFWTLIIFYSHIGAHHILQAPVSNSLKAVSIADSLAMAIPVFTVLANLWLTARGRGGALLQNPAGRFVLVGTVWYLLTCIQGPLQSLPALQKVTHFNNWTIGHSHIAVLGFSGFIALGAMWLVVPQITGRRVYSGRLVFAQFWLITFGLTGFLFVLTIAGLIQGHAWYNGEVVVRVLPEIHPYMVLRLAFGLSIISGALVGLYNLLMTLHRGPRFDPMLQEDYFA